MIRSWTLNSTVIRKKLGIVGKGVFFLDVNCCDHRVGCARLSFLFFFIKLFERLIDSHAVVGNNTERSMYRLSGFPKW